MPAPKRDRSLRRLSVTRYGRCQFCGQWVTGGQHSNLARMAAGKPWCTGKPRGRRRLSYNISPPGVLTAGHRMLTAAERVYYAEELAQLETTMKEDRARVYGYMDVPTHKLVRPNGATHEEEHR